LTSISQVCNTQYLSAIGTKTAMSEETKTLTIRLDESFHHRLKTRLLADRTNFQAKVQAMLRDYVDGPAEQREDIARQVAIAREAMRRYAPAMRELAR
jgi:hypothetical protein